MSLPDPPYNAVFFNELKRCGDVWLKWFELLKRALNLSSQVVGASSGSGLSASVAATSFNTANLPPGLYQVNCASRVTRAASSSSTLTPFVTVTQDGLTVTYTGSTNTSNDVTVGGCTTFTVLSDAITGATPVKYGMTYGSVGGTTMQYRYNFRVMQLPEAA